VDVKDYVLSGEIDDLVNDVMEIFAKMSLSRRKAIKDALYFLIYNQYVISKHHVGSCWRVILGTGMGLPQSGAIAEAAFYVRVEEYLLPRQSALGINWYFRFKDDVFMSFINTTYARHGLNLIRSKAKYFNILLEHLGFVSATFLNVTLSKSIASYIISPHFKATSLMRPLGEDSVHVPSLHKSWPVMVTRNLFTLASSWRIALEAKNKYVQRFIRFGASDILINKLQGTYGVLHKQNRFSKPVVNQNSMNAWLTLPYHPAWAKTLAKNINAFLEDDENIMLLSIGLGKPSCIKVSWKNYCPTITTLIVT